MRAIGLILVGALVAYLAVCGVMAGLYRWRELLEHERSWRYEREHPRDFPGCLGAEAVVSAATASRCLGYELGGGPQEPAAAVDSLGGYPIRRQLSVPGMSWGRRFLTQVALWGGRPRRDICEFEPSLGLRFVAGHDTTVFLLDLKWRSEGRGVLEAQWTREGRRLSQRGWLPNQFESSASAESVIANPEVLAPSLRID